MADVRPGQGSAGVQYLDRFKLDQTCQNMASAPLLCPASELEDSAYAGCLNAPCQGYIGDSQFFAVETEAEQTMAVESVNCESLTYTQHVIKFLEPNQPVLIQV